VTARRGKNIRVTPFEKRFEGKRDQRQKRQNGSK
jgi:hypothetical protein